VAIGEEWEVRVDVIDGLFEDMARQRAFVATRCPPYERLLGLLPDALPLERLARAWQGRRFGGHYERPLLLLACLRDDALEEGPTHPLHALVGPAADPEAASLPRVREALDADRPVWQKLARRHVQTNETGRAVAWLWPAHLLGHRLTEPLSLVDVGASAGLNLVADELPRIWSREGGGALAVDPLPPLGQRTGFDLRPLDVADDLDARWLRACVWPGQTERLDRLERAIAAWRASDPRPELRGTAGWSLGRIGGSEALEALQAAAAREADPEALAMIRAALHALEGVEGARQDGSDAAAAHEETSGGGVR